MSFKNSLTQWVKSAIADDTTYNDEKNKQLISVMLKLIVDESLNSGQCKPMQASLIALIKRCLLANFYTKFAKLFIFSNDTKVRCSIAAIES